MVLVHLATVPPRKPQTILDGSDLKIPFVLSFRAIRQLTCMQWHTGWAGSLVGEEQTPPSGVSACLPSPRDQDICCDSIVTNIIYSFFPRLPTGPQEVFCQPVHKLSPICAGMSQTLNKKQLKEELWNPNLVASESIFWSNSVTPADLDHPGVPRFFQWCGRSLFSHKVVISCGAKLSICSTCSLVWS